MALATFAVGLGTVSAQTTTVPASAGSMTAVQEKALVKNIKKIKAKSSSTKHKIAINKNQLNKKITAVKKARTAVKNKRLKTKTAKPAAKTSAKTN